jgi:hypothetical protein
LPVSASLLQAIRVFRCNPSREHFRSLKPFVPDTGIIDYLALSGLWVYHAPQRPMLDDNALSGLVKLAANAYWQNEFKFLYITCFTMLLGSFPFINHLSTTNRLL